MSKYVSVCLPRNLTDLIDKQAEKNGFISRAEFVKQAVRNELRRMKR